MRVNEIEYCIFEKFFDIVNMIEDNVYYILFFWFVKELINFRKGIGV